MEGALFVALLAIARMRRRVRKKKNKGLKAKQMTWKRRRGVIELQKLKKKLNQSITYQKYVHGTTSVKYIDIYINTLKTRHDVLAIFYNAHLYFGRKELLSILFIRALLKVVVISLLFEFKMNYTTTKVVQGSLDLLLFKILTVLSSFVTNKIVGTIIKAFFVKYVNAKKNYHLGYYKLKMKEQDYKSMKVRKKKNNDNKNDARSRRRKKKRASLIARSKIVKRDSRYVSAMRFIVWTFSILIVLAALLFMWIFAFTVHSEFLLDSWLETCGISLCCWLFVIRPLQIALQARGGWKKKKKRYDKHMQLIDNKMMNKIILNFNGGQDNDNSRKIINDRDSGVGIEMKAVAIAIK